MKTSDNINELATALSKAQEEIHNPSKSADNPFFKSRYADLAEVLSVVRPAFSAQGLSFIQMPFTSESGNAGVTTRLMHSSGQWMEESIDIPLQSTKNIAQETGKTITYLRRYALASFAGVAQEDNDGNLGTDKASNTGEVTSLRDVPKLGLHEVETIKHLIKETDTDENLFLGFLKVEKLELLPLSNFASAVKALESKKRKMPK